MATTISPLPANASPARSATAAKDVQASGLSNEEACRRLEKVGPNAMPDTALRPLRKTLEKFWAPVVLLASSLSRLFQTPIAA